MSSEIKQAILPREFMRITVDAMRPGESGYVHLDELHYTDDGRVWLWRSATVFDDDDEDRVAVSRTDSGHAVFLLGGQKVRPGQTYEDLVVPVVDVTVAKA